MQIITVFLIIIFNFIAYGAVFSIAEISNSSFGFHGEHQIDLIKVIILSGGNLIGIYSRVLLEMIKSVKGKKVKILTVIKDSFSDRLFWLAFISAPAIILLFYKQISLLTSYSTIAYVSYLNGFFYKSVINDRK